MPIHDIHMNEAGCDLVHVDVMDGHFVPNLTIGPVVVSAIAKAATKPLDIHLMFQNNTFFVELFAPFKPEFISFHIEEEKHPHRLIQKIRSLGIRPAIVLNPHTPPEAIEFLLSDLRITSYNVCYTKLLRSFFLAFWSLFNYGIIAKTA